MVSPSNPRRKLARAATAAALIALPIAGCAAGAATLPQPTTTVQQAGPEPPASTRISTPATTSIDRLTAVAKRRYATEVGGGQARATLRRVARDPALQAALRAGDVTRMRAAIRSRFDRVWYHWHVSRLRIVRGTRMLVDVGVPFVVAPSQTTLRDSRGHGLGTLQVSIQDEIGFVRYMHRNYPVEVVVRGIGAAHVRTSLPAALDARLPDSGTATVAGRRYKVRSFTATALGGEPVRAWILQAA
jgi:hypothetical protein